MYISVAEPDLQIVGGGEAEIRGAPPLDTPLHFVSAVSNLR